MRVPDDDTPLHCAVSLHHINAINVLIEIYFKHHLTPNADVLDKPIKKKENDTLEIILEAFPSILTLNSLDLIIRTRQRETWDLAISKRPEILANSDVLHLAVKAQTLEIVKAILEVHPELVERRDTNGLYVLEHNKAIANTEESLAVQEAIRKLLLEEILRRFNPTDIKRMFWKAKSKQGLPRIYPSLLTFYLQTTVSKPALQLHVQIKVTFWKY